MPEPILDTNIEQPKAVEVPPVVPQAFNGENQVPQVFRDAFTNGSKSQSPKQTAQPIMVDGEDANLPEAVAGHLTEGGIPTTPKQIIPDPSYILKGAGELIDAVGYSVGKDAQVFVKGEESDTFNR